MTVSITYCNFPATTTPLGVEPGLIAHFESRASAPTNSAKGSDRSREASRPAGLSHHKLSDWTEQFHYMSQDIPSCVDVFIIRQTIRMPSFLVFLRSMMTVMLKTKWYDLLGPSLPKGRTIRTIIASDKKNNLTTLLTKPLVISRYAVSVNNTCLRYTHTEI